MLKYTFCFIDVYIGLNYGSQLLHKVGLSNGYNGHHAVGGKICRTVRF